jgi:RimJ/RimL family protein N-acetyltransferase
MEINGTKTILRDVKLEDAKFICDLRNKSKNNKYLSSSKSIKIKEQQEWLTNYLKKENEFYFIIESVQLEKQVGTISLYNILNNTAEFGRYVCESAQQSIESEFLLLKFAFEELKLDLVYCKTVKENEKTWKQHLKYGFKIVSEEYHKNINQILIVQEINRDVFKKYNYDWISNLLIKLR